MKKLLIAALSLMAFVELQAQSSTEETGPRKDVQSFYNSHDFARIQSLQC